MNALVRYDAMCLAISEAHAIDEVKDIHDQAVAIEAYARQAKNTDAEQKACEIRLRAERRAGKMLSEMEKQSGARGTPGPGRGKTVSQPATPFIVEQPRTLSDIGISRTQSSRWQKLAAIPEDDFEATFAKPGKASTAGLIAAHQIKTAPPAPVAAPTIDLWQEPAPEPESEPKVAEIPDLPVRKQVDPRALWLWGRLLDFEREGILAADPNELVGSMLDHMTEATRELAPLVAAWLGRIVI